MMKNKIKTITSRVPKMNIDKSNSVCPPIWLTSTFFQKNLIQKPQFEYSRVQNPTRQMLEEKLTEIEGGVGAVATCSGQSATALVLSSLHADDHIISNHNAYDGTFRLLNKVFKNFKLRFDLADLTDLKQLQSKISKRTKFIWFETPTNPLLEIIDIKKVSEIAKKNNVKVLVDNTIAGPCSQKPIKLGADIVLHSLTKSISGHTDVTGGALIVKDKSYLEELKFLHHTLGVSLSPFEAFMSMRGIKTLVCRTKQSENSALKVARFLQKSRKVKKVIFPALKNHPNHEIYKKQMSGPGSLISFEINGTNSDINTMLNKLKLILIASSFGGPESLIQHPLSMIDQTELINQDKNKIGENLLRLWVGLEDSRDLIADLDQALQSVDNRKV